MPESLALPILGGISAVTGALGAKKTTTTSSAPVYTTDQQSMQHQLSDAIGSQLNNPASLAPEQTAAASQVNNQYDAISKRLQAQFSGRGFGRSGSLVTNQQGVEQARAGAQGGLTSQFAQMQLDQQNRVMQEAQMFGFASPGSSGTSTSGGSPIAGALGAGSETITTLFALNKMMQSGGGKGIFG
jgi:hypothetical protein